MAHDVEPYPPLSPYLSIEGAAKAIDWYRRAFGAEETERYDHEGRVGHSTLKINGGYLMLADDFPEYVDRVGTRSPDHLGGTTSTINLSVDDVDRWWDRAMAEGAVALYRPNDEFYGRHGKLRDPFGHVWSLTGPKKGSVF
jgi:PhnB protein